MPKLLRVRGDMPVQALRHPDHGFHVTPDPSLAYEESDPLVKAYRWAFESDEEAAKRQATPRGEAEMPLERATARPGEKRNTRRS